MSEHKLKVNQNFELVVKKGPFKGNYLSKIADIGDKYIKVTMPFVRGEIVPLRMGLDLEMYFTGEMAAYSYSTKTIDREFEQVPILILSYPQKKKRIQRREYFRLEVKEEMSYRLLNSDLEPISDMKQATTIDISGGGVKLVSKENIPNGTLLEIYLKITTLENTPIISRVVNIFDLPEGTAVGVKFIEIANHVREDIISWLFDYQRELRRKGML